MKNEIKYSNNKIIRRLDSAMIISCFVATIFALNQILSYAHYGIDFTDEGLYIVWISNPFQYKWSISQFGFIYYPLYALLDGNIATIRQANITLTHLISSILVFITVKKSNPDLQLQNATIIAIASGLSISSLFIFESWLITPNYNSLTLQALLISSIGLILAEKKFRQGLLLSAIIFGTGQLLTFMAKPTSGLALIFASILYLIISRKFSLWFILVSAACSSFLALLSAILIDNSVHDFYNRLLTGAELARHLSGGHSLSKIVRLDEFELNKKDILSMILAGTAALITLSIALGKKNIHKISGAILSSLFLGISIYISLGKHNEYFGFSEFQGLIIWSIVLPSAAIFLISLHPKYQLSINPSILATVLQHLIMPYIYAFGTNGNYWRAQGSASIFWLLIVVFFLAPLTQRNKNWAFCLPLVMLSQALSIALLQTGQEKPYRQNQPLRLNSAAVEIGASGSNLILSEEYKNYIKDSKAGAQAAGLNHRTPVIDLTGQSPTLLYALRAENLGQAWIIGGYPGSLKLASAVLEKVTCEKLSSAWLLVEPTGPRSISTDLLLTFGADISTNYIEASSWFTAKGAGGYNDARKQILYKPISQNELINNCHSLRQR